MDAEQGLVVDWERCDACLACTQVCFARSLRPVARRMSVDEVMSIVEQDKGFYDNTGGGLTISGGEALMHAEFVGALIDAAADRGIAVCLDTCGLGATSTLLDLAHRENVTTILYDLKTTDSAVHKAYTGVDNEAVICHLRLLAADDACGTKVTVRMPLIHGVNDDETSIRNAADLLASCGVKRIDLLPYHALGVSKQRNIGGVQQEFQPPTEERVAEIQSYFKDKLSAEVGILGKA